MEGKHTTEPLARKHTATLSSSFSTILSSLSEKYKISLPCSSTGTCVCFAYVTFLVFLSIASFPARREFFAEVVPEKNPTFNFLFLLKRVKCLG